MGQFGRLKANRLLADLGSKDCQARQRAVSELTKIGRPAVDSLVRALKDPRVDVRRAAARILAEIEEPSAIAALLASTHDRDPCVRRTAARGLGRLFFRYGTRQRSRTA